MRGPDAAAPPAGGDRLRELAAIGTRWAATAFAQLAGRVVLSRDPALRGSGARGLPAEWSTGLFFETAGDLPGLAAILLTRDSRREVIRLLLGGDPARPGAGPGASALHEFGNIVASQAISAIANALGIRIPISVPELVEPEAGAELGARLRERGLGGTTVHIESELFDSERALRALLVFAPDPDPGAAA